MSFLRSPCIGTICFKRVLVILYSAFAWTKDSRISKHALSMRFNEDEWELLIRSILSFVSKIKRLAASRRVSHRCVNRRTDVHY
jgi:hypothetical protein